MTPVIVINVLLFIIVVVVLLHLLLRQYVVSDAIVPLYCHQFASQLGQLHSFKKLFFGFDSQPFVFLYQIIFLWVISLCFSCPCLLCIHLILYVVPIERKRGEKKRACVERNTKPTRYFVRDGSISIIPQIGTCSYQ